MSRSRKKTPISGFTLAQSEKAEKQAWHRAMRHAENQRVKAGMEPLADERAYSSPWRMSKDGKRYHDKSIIAESPDLLRK